MTLNDYKGAVETLLKKSDSNWIVDIKSSQGLHLGLKNKEQIESVDDIVLKDHGDTFAQVLITGPITHAITYDERRDFKNLGYYLAQSAPGKTSYLTKTIEFEKLPYELSNLERVFNIKITK